MLETGQNRVVIEEVTPEVDCGRFPIKRTAGERVIVEADIFADGHDAVSGVLLYRKEEDPEWTEVPMEPQVNDRWRGEFTAGEPGRYRYCLQAWVDRFQSWQHDIRKKVRAGQTVEIELQTGAELLEEAASGASPEDVEKLKAWASRLRAGADLAARVRLASDADLAALMRRRAPRRFACTYSRELPLEVDREKARFSAWYEIFPRSCAAEPGRHGTFRDCEDRLAYIASMGFDVLYLAPIHPVGRSFRKGKNNAAVAGSDDPGSPWAIGSEEGGHKAVHPQLGTLQDFRRLLSRAREYRLEVALDLAFQCTPDHPYVKEHPEWFRRRADGTVQYAENPPKKYQDIYPFDFETDRWRELWEELRSVVLFWIDQGVRIFRVDNPHTKPFAFWEWLISDVKKQYPEVIFLSEAFTRPKVMYRLAKLGFTQSYTYFAWRNTKRELTEYFSHLTASELREFFRPNLWPNTPDILTEYLQFGGRPAFISRLVLAATLGASYGIYGPAFELCENRAREPRSEEYLDSEKYEIKHWDLARSGSLKDLIARINRIRRENPALHSNEALRFHAIDNDELICYSKRTADLSNVIVAVVNLDPHHVQDGWLELPVEELGITPDSPYQVHDLLGGGRYLWQGRRNYVQINPRTAPAHLFRLRRRVRTEHDFDYYM